MKQFILFFFVISLNAEASYKKLLIEYIKQNITIQNAKMELEIGRDGKDLIMSSLILF